MKIRRKYQLSCIKGLIVFLIPIILNTLYLSPAFAVDATPSADIQAKLQQLKAEIASKAAQLKNEVDQKLQNRAYVGIIRVKSQNSLTLATDSGPKLVSLNQDTDYDTNSKKIKSYSAKKMAEEDYVAALGDIDDSAVLTAKKLILLDPPKEATKAASWGQVSSLQNKSFSIKDRQQKRISVSFDEDTTFKKGEDEISFSNLKVGDFVIVSGILEKDNSISSSLVYVLPQGVLIKPKIEQATPSATVQTSKAVRKK